MLLSILIYILMFTKRSKHDPVLKQLPNKGIDIFKAVPKHWFEYNNMMLHKCLEKNIRNGTGDCYEASRMTMLQCSKQHLISKLKTEYQYKSEYIQTINCNLGNNVLGFCNDVTTRRASGMVDIYVLSKYPHVFKINFHIDPILGLNITFYTIFSMGGFKHCQIEWIKLLIFNDTNNQTFIYCGHYPSFNFYPVFRNLEINIIVHLYLELSLNFIYTMIDNLLINSFSTESSFNFKTFSNFHSYKTKSHYIDSFFIQMGKVYNIVLRDKNVGSQEFVIIMYDGPGFSSPVLNITRNKYTISSTFQCILQIVFHNDLFLLAKRSLIYIARKRWIDKSLRLIQNKTLFYKIPNKALTKSRYSVSIETNIHFQIKGSVEQLTYRGVYNPSCLFGGLVVAERIINYEESLTVCDNSDEKIRRFYSQSSSFIIVVYWYKGYSEIEISLRLDQTKCKAVQFDPCVYKIFCEYNLCQKYIFRGD